MTIINPGKIIGQDGNQISNPCSLVLYAIDFTTEAQMGETEIVKAFANNRQDFAQITQFDSKDKKQTRNCWLTEFSLNVINRAYFISLWLIWGNICNKGKVHKNNKCCYFCKPFPFEANMSPY